jgi:FKBP-type peptidyl-prolyl cis-trans isomerase
MFLNRTGNKASAFARSACCAMSCILLMAALSACGSNENGKETTIPPPPDVAAPPPGSLKTTSGLSTKVLQPGAGTRHPRPTDRVRVHYTGWTTDGKMFDSSVARNQAAEFALNRVIPGWTEGLQLMVEGEKRRFWIPANLAYEGQPDQPQGMLVFDVELIRIL